MGSSYSSAISSATAEYLLVQTALPDRGIETVGVLLLDPETNRLHSAFRRDWGSTALDEEEIALFEELPADLVEKSKELGARQLIEWLETNCSNAIRVSGRESVFVDTYEKTLHRLYRKHVQVPVIPFRTHLPLYTLRAAAGSFGDRMEVEPEGWEETPEGLRLTQDMFVAHVTGKSMEPTIPDGSLCIFRYHVTGSRQGRFVLVENYGDVGENRYTVKRYRSFKRPDEDSFKHERIILEPLNPEYAAWDLEPDSQVRILAEFVQVLRGPE